jgi:hypothetical protein
VSHWEISEEKHMSHTFRLGVAAGTITVVGLIGVAAPAQAATSDVGCDPVTLTAALQQASADARTAQRAYTTRTGTSMKTLVNQLKSKEKAEARSADRRADRLAVRAVKDKTLRDEAFAARRVARAEAREAAKVERASFAQARALVRSERRTLKATWEAAKTALRTLRVHAASCDENAAVPPAPQG